MIRPFSAVLSSTFHEEWGYYPAHLSIDNDVSTYAEAHEVGTDRIRKYWFVIG